MPVGLQRIYRPGHLHYITFSCYRRLPLLSSEPAKNLLIAELARVRHEYQFLLIGYVVMPEHVHLMMSQPKEGEVSTVLQMLKQRTSWKIRRSNNTSDTGKPRPEFPQEAVQITTSRYPLQTCGHGL